MPRLIPCPSCHAHVLVEDHECPHCEAPLRSVGAPLAAAVIAGLVLASCVSEPEYGAPATTGPEPATSTAGDTDTTAATSLGADTDGSTDSTYAATTSSTSLGADTDGSTDSTHAGTSSTTDGDASAGEADYGTAGLPATDTGTGTTSG